jgi:hypothetical protein
MLRRMLRKESRFFMKGKGVKVEGDLTVGDITQGIQK